MAVKGSHRVFLAGALAWTAIVFGAVFFRPHTRPYDPPPDMADFIWVAQFWVVGLLVWAVPVAGMAWLVRVLRARGARGLE